MLKYLILAYVLFSASTSPASFQPYPPQGRGWACYAQSEAGYTYGSPIYQSQIDAQNAAVDACYRSGARRCLVSQCVQR